MTREKFKKMTDQGVVLLDGAIGTILMKRGMPRGVSAEQWAAAHPEILEEIQRAYAKAGSRIIYAPTFAANRISLGTFGLEDQVRRLNTELIEITRRAVGDRALVAGDLTTTGRLLEPKGDISYEEMYQVYQEQIRVLADAGADLLVAETMMNVDETVVALDAAQSVCDLPVMCTLSVEADGTAMFGGNAVEAVTTLQEMGASAVGLNCSVGPDQLEAVVRSMKEVARVPVIAKPNAGIPSINEKGEAVYSMNPEDFAKHMKVLVEAGAGIVGGCCGTTPEYIRKLAQTLGLRGN